MLSRNKVIKKIEKYKLDFDFYIEFCNIAKIYNDIIYYYGNEDIKNKESYKLSKDIAITIFEKVNFETLLRLYVTKYSEHVSYYIFIKELGIDITILLNEIEKSIFKCNEFPTNTLAYLKNQINFLNNTTSYYLLKPKNTEFTMEEYQKNMKVVCTCNKIELTEYIQDIKNNLKEYSIFDELIREIIREVEYEL